MTMKSVEGLTDRDQLFRTLCDRYTKSAAHAHISSDKNIPLDFNLGLTYQAARKSSTFAEAVALERHNSAMMEAKKSERIGVGLGTNVNGSMESFEFETDLILNDLVMQSQSSCKNEFKEI